MLRFQLLLNDRISFIIFVVLDLESVFSESFRDG